jgi:hypothetical protein
MAAITAHVAQIAFMAINKRTGQPLNKKDPDTTIADTLAAEYKQVILPDTTNPSSTTPTKYPTINEYIQREAGAGFKVQYMNQNTIVTYT